MGRSDSRINHHTHENREGNTMAHHHPVPPARGTVMHSLTNASKVKCVILKKTRPQKRLHGCLNMKQRNGVMINNVMALIQAAGARSPWRRRCGCRGNAEGCRPQLPEEVLYARCTPSDCPPRSPHPHTDGERERCMEGYK